MSNEKTGASNTASPTGDGATIIQPDAPSNQATIYEHSKVPVPLPNAAQPDLDGATLLKPSEALSGAARAAPPQPRPGTTQAGSAAPAADPQANLATLYQTPAAPPPIPGAMPYGKQQTADGLSKGGLGGNTPSYGTAAPSVSKSPSKPTTAVPVGTKAPSHHSSPTGDPNAPVGKLVPPKPGDHVNHYELIRELGKGGMGSVFLARDEKLGRRVAIKFLHTNHPELTKRFVLEARTTARFSHENIVIIYEVDSHNGQPYMVLEYLQGQPLTKLIVDQKPMPPGRVVELMQPVIKALASAHAQNIVHRDLKFDNVFVTESGLIKVLDFGIAKVLGGDEKQMKEASAKEIEAEASSARPDTNAELTRHGTIMGTLAFMSPEQWGKGGPIDHRADIWAAGIMLFRMLAGKHPLAPLSGMQLSVTSKMDEPMPKLNSFVPSLPAELAAVVDRCLLKKKEDRWPDANALLRALEPFLPGRATREFKIDESPYAGLASFQESDADRFFGRNAEIAACVNRIRDTALVGVVGASGSGKSSFVRAGVVPALKRSGESWESLVIRPGRKPLQALADIVAPLLSTSTNVQEEMKEQQKLVQRLQKEPGYVGSVLRARARREKRNILVFVDQFEELYTLVPDQEERLTFTACMASIADDPTSPTRVVLSIRSDFLDRVAEDQAFMAELTKGLIFLNKPAKDGLRDAIVQPAEMAGYHFESPAIVDDMLGHLAATQGALPLLQFAAAKLWDSRDAARKLLTTQSYEAIGGIAGALASHADAVVNELPPQARNLCRALFLRLVTPERTRAIVPMDELRELSQNGAEAQRLVDQLVQARLLVVNTAGGGATVEVVHESLIATWPMLRRWLDESGEDAAFLEQLRTAAKQWQQKGKDSGLLWSGEAAEEASRFEKRYRGELPRLQREFLDAVFLQQQKQARRKRTLTVGGFAFLGLLLAAATVALVTIANARGQAEQQAVVAKQAEADALKQKSLAEKSLAEVKAKETERAAAAKKAQEEAERANKLAEEATQKQKEAEEAEAKAVQFSKVAAWQKLQAEQNAKKAAAAAALAKQKADEAKALADQNAQRAAMLEKQLGSPVIDQLK